ncbi:MAG TPA: sensor domain-containing diguanylate cyclase [Pseudidiomarina sp.]|nr:sensor domain-containing diguanylate cyclase [Pseudidiomarina sp.]
MISEISAQLINCPYEHTEQHISQALAALGHGDRKDRCYVFLFNADYSTMSNTHEWVNADITAHIDELQDVPRETMPWFFEQMLQHGQVVVSALDDLPDIASGFRDELAREHIRSMMAVGMYLEGQLLGFVGCDLVNRQVQWSEHDVRQMRLVADLIANTIARQRSEAKLRKTEAELRLANQRLAQLAREDGLTGLVNRRGLDEALQHELQRARRNAQRLTVFMIDVDHFKSFNDVSGHVAGDQALKAVAKVFRAVFKRSGEVVARYGGDEFFVVSPQCVPSEAQERAKRILENVRQLKDAGDIEQPVTVSIGIASLIPSADDDVDSLLRIVDQAVYQAKHHGRDCSALITV